MWIDVTIFIIGCTIISYLLYEQIKMLWYENIMKRTMKGEDLSGLTDGNAFKEVFGDIAKRIISDYENRKSQDKQEDNEIEDKMYQ